LGSRVGGIRGFRFEGMGLFKPGCISGLGIQGD